MEQPPLDPGYDFRDHFDDETRDLRPYCPLCLVVALLFSLVLWGLMFDGVRWLREQF